MYNWAASKQSPVTLEFSASYVKEEDGLSNRKNED
jgi:hypothetical protein